MSDRRKELAISKRIADNKLKAFSIGKTNPIPKKGSVLQRREKEQEKKKLDLEETRNVFLFVVNDYIWIYFILTGVR